MVPPWLFALPQTPAFGVCRRQGLQSPADACSHGLSLLFSSPLPITDVWLHTCSIHEWLPGAANHKGRLDQMEALTDRHRVSNWDSFFPPPSTTDDQGRGNTLWCTEYRRVPKPQTGCFGERSVLITTRSLLLVASSPCFPCGSDKLPPHGTASTRLGGLCQSRRGSSPARTRVYANLRRSSGRTDCRSAPCARAPPLAACVVKVALLLVKIPRSCPFHAS